MTIGKQSLIHGERNTTPIKWTIRVWKSSWLKQLYAWCQCVVMLWFVAKNTLIVHSERLLPSVMRQQQYLIPHDLLVDCSLVRHRPSACRYPLSLLIAGWWSVPCLPPPLSSGPSNLHHPSLPVGEAPEQCSSQPSDASLTPLSSSRGSLGASSPPHQMSDADQWRGLVQHLRLL